MWCALEDPKEYSGVCLFIFVRAEMRREEKQKRVSHSYSQVLHPRRFSAFFFFFEEILVRRFCPRVQLFRLLACLLD